MSDDAIVGAIAGLLLGNITAERGGRVTYDEAKAARERAFLEAEVAFKRDLDNSKTSSDCDDALALCKARLDEAHAQFLRATRRSE